MSNPSVEDDIPLAPRAASADDFEQNPLPLVHTRLQASAIDPARVLELTEEERVREAVRRVIQDGTSIHDAAHDLHLSAASIQAWRARYSSFLEETVFGETNPDAAAEDAVIGEPAQRKFLENWERLLNATQTKTQDFHQEPLEVFLQTSTFTNWLYDEEGKVDRFTIAGTLVVLLGVLTVIIFLTNDRGHTPRDPDVKVRSLPALEAGAMVPPDVQAASESVQRFLKASSYIDKLAFIKDREQVGPQLREYYQRHSDAPVRDAILIQTMEGKNTFSLSFDIPSRKATWFFNSVLVGDTYRIDWPTSTLCQTDIFERFMASKSTQPTILHVRMVRGNYYNYEWSDRQKYACYNLTFPGLQQTLYGYVPRDSPLGIELQLLTALEPTHAAILEVKYPSPAPEDRQVEILRIISKEWLPEP